MAYREGVFYWRDRTGPLDWGFTDRLGGGSAAPYDTLNLGGHVGDDPETVRGNRALVAAELGLEVDRLLFLNQCHGTEVIAADGPWRGADPVPADGVVSSAPDLALAVLVADCVPVLLADPGAGVVGAVHAGRPGMTTGIIDRAVEGMRAQGATEVRALVGPSVCGRCYEVPDELRDVAAAVVAESATVSWTGTPAIDVAAGVVAQLRANDVAVQWVPGCTRESAQLYSYRGEGITGRFAGVVRLVGP